jgi:biopolymer transport protein ExbD
MRSALLIVVTVSLASISAANLVRVGDDPSKTTPTGGVKLPELSSAKPLGRTEVRLFTLNVNAKGHVLISSADGKTAEALETPAQIEKFVKQRAADDVRAKGPRSVVVLRVDRETPFEKTYEIVKACWLAGYGDFQLRALRGNAGEGQIPLALPTAKPKDSVDPPDPEERPTLYFLRATADEKGAIKGTTISAGGDLSPTDVGTDPEALFKKLKGLAALHKVRPAILVIEMDGRLLQASVVQLVDTSIRAGFDKLSLTILSRK